MKTIALRFGETFAPEDGTIQAHQEMIEKHGFVWYGKLGNPISVAVVRDLMEPDDPKLLLIHSGSSNRYWLHIEKVQRETPDAENIPAYYRQKVEDFGCWFKVTEIEPAKKTVMSECVVRSSGKSLSLASRHSMSPYFIIEYTGD